MRPETRLAGIWSIKDCGVLKRCLATQRHPTTTGPRGGRAEFALAPLSRGELLVVIVFLEDGRDVPGAVENPHNIDPLFVNQEVEDEVALKMLDGPHPQAEERWITELSCASDPRKPG